MRAYAVYLLARQGIRPNAALANVEQELTNRYPKDWPSDLAAAYLASTYRLMQRTADAERIVRNVPWSPDKGAIGDDIYYDAVVHDAQLLYLLAAHFPTRVNTVPPVALETLSAAISGNRTSSLSAAYTLLALDAFSKAVGQCRHARHRAHRHGWPRDRLHAAGRRHAEGQRSRGARPGCDSRAAAR